MKKALIVGVLVGILVIGGCLWLIRKNFGNTKNPTVVSEKNMFGDVVRVASMEGVILDGVNADENGIYYFKYIPRGIKIDEGGFLKILVSYSEENTKSGRYIVENNTKKEDMYEIERFNEYVIQKIGKKVKVDVILINDDLWDRSYQALERSGMNMGVVDSVKSNLMCTVGAIDNRRKLDDGCNVVYFYKMYED